MKINLLKFSKSSLFILYIVGFIFSFTSSIPAFINSSFLKSITSENIIGVLYSVASIFSLFCLILIPKILKKFGNYKVTFFLVIVQFINFLCLAFLQNIYLILISFMLSGAITTIIYFNLDVFIEHFSINSVTGGIRSIYLTCINLAWLLSPWIAGVIVGKCSYRHIYLIVALIMVPLIFIVSSNLKKFKDPEYKTFDIVATIKSISTNANIKNIVVCSLLLQSFYAFMIVYTPIYLNQYIGFSWTDIGIMFSIALLPFVFIQIPLGYLADKKYGEKEILSIGLIIIGISTSVIPFIRDNNFVFWVTVLFIGRTGAAIIEVMCDTYFFKNVKDKNLNLINLYRTVTPLAYIITPIIATVILFFIPLSNIFLILGLLMIFGLKYSLALKDTR